MIFRLSELLKLIGAVLGVAFAGHADATARIGGAISVSAAGCGPSVNSSVPTTTPQDTFLLAAATGCGANAADAQLRANAASPSIGLAGQAVSSSNSSASAFVSLSDVWTIGVAPGTPLGSTFTLPVSFRLEGSVAPGSLYGPTFGRFLDVVGSLGQFGTGSGLFQFNRSIVGVGGFDQTFAGLATFTNYGPTVPLLADFNLSLSMPFLQFGAVDFYNTLSASVDVPPGFTITSSSGRVLFPVAPIPEPETYLSLIVGLTALGIRRIKCGQVDRPGQSNF